MKKSLFDRHGAGGSLFKRYGASNALAPPFRAPSILESGPIAVQIDARTPEEREIAYQHVARGHVLLGQLAVRSSNAPFLSRKIAMPGGVEIEATRNLNQYTGRYTSRIRVKVRREGAEEKRGWRKARGRYFWVGWRYREPWEPRLFNHPLDGLTQEQSQRVHMSVWEPEFEDGSHQQIVMPGEFEGFFHTFPEEAPFGSELFDWRSYFDYKIPYAGTDAGMHWGLSDSENEYRIYEPLHDPSVVDLILNYEHDIDGWSESVTMDPTQLLGIADDPGDWVGGLQPIYTGDDSSLDARLLSAMTYPGDRREDVIRRELAELSEPYWTTLAGKYKKIASGTRWPNYMVKFHVRGTQQWQWESFGDVFMSALNYHGPNQSQPHKITVKVVAGKADSATEFRFDLDIQPERFGYAWHQIFSGSFAGTDGGYSSADRGPNTGVCYGDQAILIDPYGEAWMERDYWAWGMGR